jgi:hypothetical protein
MFCPNCKAEYRSGFTRCADCHVDLVEKLPERNSPASFVVLWRGEDANFHGSLIEELERASIRFADIPLEVYLRGSSDPFRLKLGPQFGFVVSVAASDLRAARSILEKFLEREPENVSLPGPADTTTESVSMDSPDPPLHWNPELATLEIWSGNDLKRIRFLQASLRENGIPSRITESDPKKPCLLICPEDAMRASKIVKEIAKAALSETPIHQSSEYVWYDEPVRSYLFAWLPGVVYILLAAPFGAHSESSFHQATFSDVVFGIGSFISEVGGLWMAYQAIRYELQPVRFVLLAFLPFSFIWYYYERYSRRIGRQRLPIAVRMRMSPPPTA